MHKLALEQLNNIPTSLFVLEPTSEGDVTYAFLNESAIGFSQYGLSDFIGKNASQVFHGHFGQYAHEKHLEAYRTAKPLTYELSLPMDGKLRRLRTTLNPVFDSQGKLVRLIGASVDISASHELDRVRSESRSIESELQEFIYLAAHDLRGPMKKIQSIADMLREDFKDLGDGKKELIDMLESISVKSMETVRNVLEHAEITGLQESIESLSLVDACNEILGTLIPAEKHHCRIHDCSIYGDSTLLKTSLRNLIENALKHNENSEISLDISAANTVGGFYEVQVMDDGTGMRNPEKLFESSDKDRSKSGFGLLAIRKLIKRRGGHISATVGKDSTGLSVTFSLPGRVS